VAASALAEAKELVNMAADVRPRLLAERAEHVAKIQEIDLMLAELPGQKAPTHSVAPASPPRGAPNTKTVPGILLAIIGASPGLTSNEVIAAAQKKRKIDAPGVYSNLYRLKKNDLIRCEGPKGSTRYFLAEPSEGASA
jgi:hypothetical protein